jgi:hypothetical protein
MLRALLAVVVCLALSGCWVSDHRIFGDGDWAHVNLAGKFKRENANGDADASVVLGTQPNGLIVGTATAFKDRKSERMVMGLVAIQGGSGKYFLAVDRSSDKDTGDTYLIAHLTEDGGLELFWPDCEGTASASGMTSAKDSLSDTTVCTFTNKAGLIAAGLQAEKFLSAKHVIAIAPLGRLAPDDGSDENSTDAR